jgi:hypothetical protein
MGLHEIKKLLHNKRNGLQIEEATHRMGENLCQLYIRQGTDNQNIQGAQKTKLPQKTNDSMKKWSNELNRAFSKEDVQMSKKHMKKILTIPGHKGVANQNHTKIPPHSC